MTSPPATGAPLGGGTRPASRRRTTLLVIGAVVATSIALQLHVTLASAGVSPLVLVLLDSAPFLFLLATQPVLRRLAVRNAVRRPRETVLVLVGSMLGTAIITGSFIVGDTLDASIRAGAFTRLGPVDEMVGTGSSDALQSLDERVRRLPPSLVDGVLPFTTAAVTAANGTERAEPSALLIEVDFDRAREFGGDEVATGIEGPTPVADEVVIGRDLARVLEVEAGATIDVFTYGTRRPMKVTRVLERRGVAGLLDPAAALGGGSRAPNLFVAPGTIEELAARAGASATPPTHVLAVSNRGGVLEGADTTAEVVDALRPLVGSDGTVRAVKADLVKTAKESGEQFTSLFTSIGFFSVMAGVLLLVNIFTALAQERKVSLGMLRAVGLRRTSLVASFSLEGWIYVLGSALLGALVGILVGRAIIFVAADIFSSGAEEFSVDLRFTFDSASLTGGFTIGFVISLVTVVLSSLVIAKLNVIRAIRDLPEPPRTSKQRVAARIVGVVLALLGAVITAAGISGKRPEAALIGPSLLFLGLALALTFVVPPPLATTIGALGTIAWAVLCFGLLPDVFETAEIPVFALQGIILVAAAVAALIVNLEAIGRGVRVVGGASSMSLRLGLAYPLARRFRTGAILAMYAMVVFILTFIVVLSTLFSTQADRFTSDSAGGFEVQVKSNETNPVPAAEVRALPGVDAVAELAITNVEFDAPGFTDGFEPWPVAGFDEALADRGAPGLAEWDRARYPVEDDVWKLVANDPGFVIIHEFFLQTGGGGPPQAAPDVGSKLTMRDPLTGRTRELTIAAVADGSFVSFHVHLSRKVLDEVVGARAAPNTLYVDTVDAAAAQRVAGEVNARYLANGADSATFRSLVEEGLTAQTSFFRLMQGYIALGLVVGIAGLGVVMVRAVRERRRQVGVLRSLGFGSGQVRRAFLAEAGFIALLGILTGTVLAIIVAWRLIGTEAFGEDLPFSLPWGQLAIVVGLTFLFSLLATLAPAQQASAIRPAVALRITD